MSDTTPATESAPVIEHDPFLEAFDKLAGLGGEASQIDVDKAMDTVPPQPPAAQPEAPAQDAAAPAEGDPTAEAQPEAPAQEEPQAEQPPKDEPDDDDLLRRLSDLVRKGAPASEAPPAEAAPPAPEAPPIYTKEEQEFLSTYEKDWPDVSRAEMLRRRGEYRELAQFIFTEVAGYLKPHLETIQAVASRTHLADLEAKVNDYDDVRDKVVDWVGTQPKYLQDAYQRVIQQGTADEVADLIGRWRAATGTSATTPTQPQRTKETALPPATKQAAAALAPVGSKRSATVGGVDPNDFEGAFALAASGKG
jgi:hypothetical protein